jgi:hypothetical protein
MPTIFALASQGFKGVLKEAIFKGAQRAVKDLRDKIPRDGIFLVRYVVQLLSTLRSSAFSFFSAGPHGMEQLCTARIFDAAKSQQRYIGASRFPAGDIPGATFKIAVCARKQWRGTTFADHAKDAERWDDR